MANKREHDFYDMEVGDKREYPGQCPEGTKKSKVHTAFYKYAQRNKWLVKTSCDRKLNILTVERVK